MVPSPQTVKLSRERFGGGLESLLDLASPRESHFLRKFHQSPHESNPESASQSRGQVHARTLDMAWMRRVMKIGEDVAAKLDARSTDHYLRCARTLRNSRDSRLRTRCYGMVGHRAIRRPSSSLASATVKA